VSESASSGCCGGRAGGGGGGGGGGCLMRFVSVVMGADNQLSLAMQHSLLMLE
jgi:hypothetical protein